jgi:hypothetical protein
MLIRAYFITCAITALSAAALVSCGKPTSDPTAAAPGESLQAAPPAATVGVPAGASAPLARAADGSQELDVNAYAEQLKQDPVLYEKQKAICHNAGPEANPRSLDAVCAAFDTARTDLDHERTDRQYGVTNKDSL